MHISNVGHTPIHNIDSEPANSDVRSQERPVRNHPAPLNAQAESVAVDSGLMSRNAPEGADPKLWEMLGPAERAYLSGGFDRFSYGPGSGGSTLGRGAHVDMRV